MQRKPWLCQGLGNPGYLQGKKLRYGENRGPKLQLCRNKATTRVRHWLTLTPECTGRCKSPTTFVSLVPKLGFFGGFLFVCFYNSQNFQFLGPVPTYISSICWTSQTSLAPSTLLPLLPKSLPLPLSSDHLPSLILPTTWHGHHYHALVC